MTFELHIAGERELPWGDITGLHLCLRDDVESAGPCQSQRQNGLKVVNIDR